MVGASPHVRSSVFEELVTDVTDGIVLLDTSGRILFATPRVADLLGYRPEELREQPIGRLFPDARPDPVEFLLERATRNEETQAAEEIELSLTHADGQEVTLTLAVRELDHEDQRYLGVILRDRSESEESRRYEAIANTVDDGIYQLDENGTFVAVNDQVVATTGYDRDRLLGSHVSLLLEDETIDRIERRIRSLLRAGEESTTLDLDVWTATGEAIPCELRLRILLTDGEFAGTVGVVRDVSERIEREREASHRSTAMEAAMEGIGISDGNGELRYVNRALADLHGYDDPADLVGESWQVLFSADEVERLEREVLPTVLERGYWCGDAVGKRADGSEFPQNHSLAAHDDGVVCVVRDVSERKARERQLEALNEVTRELMTMETRDEIARIGIDAIETVLGFEIACLRFFDRDANRLDCLALTDGARELLETQAAYDLEATLAGRAFRTETTLINVPPESDPSGATVFEESSAHVPIGSYGVLSLLRRGGDAFEDGEVHLTEMLAMDIGAALARAERTELLQTQERELGQQRDQLETLNRINAVNTEISDSLVTATTREELDRTICEHLVESELYRSAWIGRIEGTVDRITRVIGVNVNESYLETVTKTDLSEIACGTVARTVETGATQVVRQYQIDGTGDAVAGDADGTVEAIAAVPLLYGDRIVGVLVVNSTREDVFSAKAIAGFESLGKIIGYAQNALKSRELLLSDAVVELEFRLVDPSVFYVQVTNELDCRCEFERAMPVENGRVIHYDTISDADPAAVLAAAEASPHIESARVLSDRGDSCVLQTATANSMVQRAFELGTTVRSATAEGGTGTVVIEAPQSANVRDLVTAFKREFDGLELVAKREREHSVTTADEFRDAVANRLTNKQRAALESAYVAGYYDWPRKITAEELADSIGISSSTLHQHLRRGNWCLLSAFFEDLEERERDR